VNDVGTGAIPPGWYPDPWQPNTWRWWDGQQWTEAWAPMEATGAHGSVGSKRSREYKAAWLVGVGAVLVIVFVIFPVAVFALIFATAPDPASNANDIHQQLTEAGLHCRGWKVHYGAPSGYIGEAEWANGRCTLPSGATLEVSTFDNRDTLRNWINEPVPRHAAPSYETGQEIGSPWLEGGRYAVSAPFEQAAPSAEARAQAEQEMALVFKTLNGTKHAC